MYVWLISAQENIQGLFYRDTRPVANSELGPYKQQVKNHRLMLGYTWPILSGLLHGKLDETMTVIFPSMHWRETRTWLIKPVRTSYWDQPKERKHVCMCLKERVSVCLCVRVRFRGNVDVLGPRSSLWLMNKSWNYYNICNTTSKQTAMWSCELTKVSIMLIPSLTDADTYILYNDKNDLTIIILSSGYPSAMQKIVCIC